MTKQTLVSADLNLFESEHLWKSANARYPEISIRNAEICYVGVDAAWLPTERPTSRADRKLVFAMTSHHPHKDNETLQQLASILGREGWSFRIAGHIPDSVRPSFDCLDNVALLGFVNREAVAAEMDAATALVATSRVESFAMVPLEAMARGLPVVVADTAAMPESVGESGKLALPGSAESFADQLRSLTDNGVWEKASAGGLAWAADMTWDTFAATCLHVLETALSRRD
jgi:glycosyltransferase involved in cell wall biosynthesis